VKGILGILGLPGRGLWFMNWDRCVFLQPFVVMIELEPKTLTSY